MRLFLQITTIAAVLLLAGCSTRGPRSEPALPPVDFEGIEWENDFQRLKTQEYLFPGRSEYVIGPGDILSLTLVGRQDMLGLSDENTDGGLKIQVSESPFIVLPHIGAIRAHGKTQLELERDLRDAYDAVIRNPVVVLTIENYHYNQVTVLGSVNKAGRYILEPGGTLVDAIFKAEGFSLGGIQRGLPPGRVIKIYREKLPRRERIERPIDELMKILSEESELSTREEILVPFDDFIIRGRLKHNLPLLPNDIVYVPPAGTVSVQGYFGNPRVVFLGPGLRLLSEVATETGGLKFKAASRVEIIRTDDDGSVESIFVDLRRVMKRKDPDIYMEDNDKIVSYLHPRRAVLDSFYSIFRASATTGVSATYSPGP